MDISTPKGLRAWIDFFIRRKRYSHLPEPTWLTAAESPFGREVVDCRGYALLRDPDPGGETLTQRAQRVKEVARQPVTALLGKLPRGAQEAGEPYTWPLSPSDVRKIQAGFLPQSPDDRWIIRFLDNKIYFQRSWTGSLRYIAELSREGDVVQLCRLWLPHSDAEGTRAVQLAMLLYLLTSHVLCKPAAVPVPRDLGDDPLRMATFAFSIAGRRGLYAELCPP